jgi:hypothetical protein
MDAALLVLETSSSSSALMTLPSFRGTASIGRFKASTSLASGATYHEYVLRVQAAPGDTGAFKLEVNYDPKSGEIYHRGLDPAKLLPASEPAAGVASGSCRKAVSSGPPGSAR